MTASSDVPQPFEVRRENSDDVPIVTLAGEIDLRTCDTVSEELAAVPPELPVVVDLCEVEFMDSSGLRVLLDEHVRRRRGVFIACAPQGPVQRLFVATKVADAILRIYDTRTDAIAAARTDR
jgi:anti-sigma B factor antagonist